VVGQSLRTTTTNARPVPHDLNIISACLRQTFKVDHYEEQRASITLPTMTASLTYSKAISARACPVANQIQAAA